MILKSKRVWIGDQFIPAQIHIEDNKIVGIYDYNKDNDCIDYKTKRILPGFIDVHCHGAYGFDTNDANKEGLINWGKNIVKEGVTAFLPTTITQSKEVLTNALKNIAEVVENGYEGAQILGVHFEGPYLSEKYKGAQPEKFIVKPSIEEFEQYQKAAKGLIKYVTLATEEDEDFAFTKYLHKNNIVVSIGHSASTYEQVLLAFANGATCQTHVYNGMTPFNHRENGLVGAAFRIKQMYGEIICDGLHSTPAALHNYFMLKGSNNCIMVTDCLMAKGFKPGTKFDFGGQQVEIYENGSAHLVSTKGLAGSTLKVNEGLKILIEDALIPFDYAINSCTINPARCLGIDKFKGRIGVGYDSDLVILNDDYSVSQTYCLGKAML